jgi:cell division protein FtsQ
MRKAIKILLWLGIAAWFILIMGFVNSEAENIICKQVDIHLMDSSSNSFVSEMAVRAFLESMEGIQGYPVSEINTRQLEAELEKDPYIKHAEIFFDVAGRMGVHIYQRKPLVRIMPENGTGYYIDQEGHVLPLSKDYTALVILVSGHISSYDNINNEILEELHGFAKYVSKHALWSDQIVQIYRNRKGEYELIPRVGAHQIILGSMDNYEMKLRNLEALYRQGLPRYGWNTYNRINLKYSNQVICTKR